jgi:methionyl-tRNA synthetase
MEPGADLNAVMGDALEAIRLVAILTTPAMPKVCEEIWRRIGLSGAPSDEVFSVECHLGSVPQ